MSWIPSFAQCAYCGGRAGTACPICGVLICGDCDVTSWVGCHDCVARTRREGGEVRLGRYSLVSRLGRSRWAEGYLCRAPPIGPDAAGRSPREVACKRPLPHGPWATRVRRAAQLLGPYQKVHGPGVAPLLEVFAEGRTWVAVQALARGHDLASLARLSGGTLPWRRAVGLVRAAAAALVPYHRLPEGAGGPLCHGDLRPHHVVVDGDAVTLVDAGFWRFALDALPEEARTVYAPEQRRGETLSPRGDVYGLGLLLCRLVARRPIGPPADGGDLLWAVVRGWARGHRPEGVPDDAPRALWEVLARALMPAPEARQADASELLQALGAIPGLA